MTDEIQKPKPKAKLRVSNFTSPGVKNRDWRCYPVDGESLEDVCDPGYWGVVVCGLSIGDRIFCLAETQEWCAELLVVDKAETWAQVVVLSYHDLTKAESVTAVDDATLTVDSFKVSYASGKGYRVLRKGDNVLIKEGMKTKAEALAAIHSYIATVTRS